MANHIIIAVFMLCTFIWQTQAAVNCTAAGRFPEPTDTTCQNYTLCVLTSNSAYIGYNYTCPSTSVFNPNTKQCTASTNYVCNANTTDTNNTTDNTTSCTSEGFIPDPSSTNCSSYLQCVLIDGVYNETTLSCPDGTLFNPNTTQCESDYNCTNSNSTSFTCDTPGRFANTDDATCQTYFYCVTMGNGMYTQYNYTCPSTSVFNPSSAMCTTSYQCPAAPAVPA